MSQCLGAFTMICDVYNAEHESYNGGVTIQGIFGTLSWVMLLCQCFVVIGITLRQKGRVWPGKAEDLQIQRFSQAKPSLTTFWTSPASPSSLPIGLHLAPKFQQCKTRTLR